MLRSGVFSALGQVTDMPLGMKTNSYEYKIACKVSCKTERQRQSTTSSNIAMPQICPGTPAGPGTLHWYYSSSLGRAELALRVMNDHHCAPAQENCFRIVILNCGEIIPRQNFKISESKKIPLMKDCSALGCFQRSVKLQTCRLV